jgi:hypothetical protein
VIDRHDVHFEALTDAGVADPPLINTFEPSVSARGEFWRATIDTSNDLPQVSNPLLIQRRIAAKIASALHGTVLNGR